MGQLLCYPGESALSLRKVTRFVRKDLHQRGILDGGEQGPWGGPGQGKGRCGAGQASSNKEKQVSIAATWTQCLWRTRRRCSQVRYMPRRTRTCSPTLTTRSAGTSCAPGGTSDPTPTSPRPTISPWPKTPQMLRSSTPRGVERGHAHPAGGVQTALHDTAGAQRPRAVAAGPAREWWRTRARGAAGALRVLGEEGWRHPDLPGPADHPLALHAQPGEVTKPLPRLWAVVQCVHTGRYGWSGQTTSGRRSLGVSVITCKAPTPPPPFVACGYTKRDLSHLILVAAFIRPSQPNSAGMYGELEALYTSCLIEGYNSIHVGNNQQT